MNVADWYVACFKGLLNTLGSEDTLLFIYLEARSVDFFKHFYGRAEVFKVWPLRRSFLLAEESWPMAQFVGDELSLGFKALVKDLFDYQGVFCKQEWVVIGVAQIERLFQDVSPRPGHQQNTFCC